MAGEGWRSHLLSPGRKVTIQIICPAAAGHGFFFHWCHGDADHQEPAALPSFAAPRGWGSPWQTGELLKPSSSSGLWLLLPRLQKLSWRLLFYFGKVIDERGKCCVFSRLGSPWPELALQRFCCEIHLIPWISKTADLLPRPSRSWPLHIYFQQKNKLAIFFFFSFFFQMWLWCGS